MMTIHLVDSRRKATIMMVIGTKTEDGTTIEEEDSGTMEEEEKEGTIDSMITIEQSETRTHTEIMIIIAIEEDTVEDAEVVEISTQAVDLAKEDKTENIAREGTKLY